MGVPRGLPPLPLPLPLPAGWVSGGLVVVAAAGGPAPLPSSSSLGFRGCQPLQLDLGAQLPQAFPQDAPLRCFQAVAVVVAVVVVVVVVVVASTLVRGVGSPPPISR